MYGKGKGGKVYPKERMGVTFHLRFLNCPTLLSARAGSFTGPTRWPCGQGVRLEWSKPGFKPRFRRGAFSCVESFQNLTN